MSQPVEGLVKSGLVAPNGRWETWKENTTIAGILMGDPKESGAIALTQIRNGSTANGSTANGSTVLSQYVKQHTTVRKKIHNWVPSIQEI